MQRRILVGLTSVAVVAAGLTTALVTGADAAPPVGQQNTANEAVGVDDLPSAAEEKRRDMRQEALSDVLSGKRKAEKRGDSVVVNMGKKAAAKSKNKAKKAGQVDQYVELEREKTDKIFVVLVEFGNERHPDYPDQDTDPNTPGPGEVRRSAAQPDPRAGPVEGQLDDLAAGLQPRALPGPLLLRRPRRRVGQELLREAVLGPVLGRRRGQRLGEGQVQRGPLRPVERLPLRQQRLQQLLQPHPGRRQRLVRLARSPPAGRRSR